MVTMMLEDNVPGGLRNEDHVLVIRGHIMNMRMGWRCNGLMERCMMMVHIGSML